MSIYDCRGAINGIIVQNNPVNFVDPNGLALIDGLGFGSRKFSEKAISRKADNVLKNKGGYNPSDRRIISSGVGSAAVGTLTGACAAGVPGAIVGFTGGLITGLGGQTVLEQTGAGQPKADIEDTIIDFLFAPFRREVGELPLPPDRLNHGVAGN